MLIYACTIFLSAFLLFQVQPVIARMILPWFGGSAAVWTTCMLFFQMVLLLGYLYVYAGTRKLQAKHQAWIHVSLLVISLLVLPITPSERWKPEPGSNPSAAILLLLGACVGLPYFLLSTTSPLLQWWYAQRGTGALPYRLFALSNLGSLLALVSYPVLVEPNLPAGLQGRAWSIAYGCFVAMCAGTALVSTRHIMGRKAEVIEDDAGDPPGTGMMVLWTALSAVPSALLLAVTNHLTQDVAAIPFLWIVPLVVYLLTFILCFEADGWYRRWLFLPLLIPSLAGMAYMINKGTEDMNLKVLLVAFPAAFFVSCMVCHGEMVRLKPHPRYLTSFYLMLSIGGALGGLFVGLVAPYWFMSYFEFPIALVVCGALAVIVLLRDPLSRFHNAWLKPEGIVMMAAVLALCIYLGRTMHRNISDYKIVQRNFYGSLRVRESGKPGETDQYRTLLHGSINHGEEWIHPTRRLDPLTYYCSNSGVGRAIHTRKPGVPQKVGVFGLGAGTIGSYGRPGDVYRFYEINPLVLRLARTEFFYLPESRGKIEVALGDARLSLEREPNQQFDVLAVDCFSGDSIPVHLLTREAIDLYFKHMKPDGVLALHVSNRFLELPPVIERIATASGRATFQVETDEDESGNCFGTTWVLVAATPEVFEREPFRGAGKPVVASPKLRLWTDDYSSLVGILK